MKGTLRFEPLRPADQEFLWDMLHVALWDPPLAGLRPREVLEEPRIAVHAASWGSSPTDLGFVAIEGEKQFGAIWSRIHREEGVGGAWYDALTPQLGIALLPEARGRGIGSGLLEVFLVQADRLFPAVSLSVHPENPARRLYERFGFVEVSRGASDYRLLVRHRPEASTECR